MVDIEKLLKEYKEVCDFNNFDYEFNNLKEVEDSGESAVVELKKTKSATVVADKINKMLGENLDVA